MESQAVALGARDSGIGWQMEASQDGVGEEMRGIEKDQMDLRELGKCNALRCK